MNTATVLALTALALSVTACNTIAGLGRDVAYTGNSIVKWSTDMRDEIPSTDFEGEKAQRLMLTDARGNLIAPPKEEATEKKSDAAKDSAKKDKNVKVIDAVRANGVTINVHDKDAVDKVAREAARSVRENSPRPSYYRY